MRRIGLAVVFPVMCLVPLAVGAQTGKVFRIGLLVISAAPLGPNNQGNLTAFRQGLRELGYREGENVVFEIRTTDGRPERLPELAAELVRLKVDVILAPSNPVIAAAQKATTSIPIVMSNATDPVASGFVASLARPGGNITGLTIQTPDVAGKALQLLTETVPGLTRVPVLWDPSFLGVRQQLSETESAARALGVQLQFVEARSPDEFEGAFSTMTRDKARAALIVGSPMMMGNRARIAELGVKTRLPTMCVLRDYVEAGCLIGYGSSLVDQFRRAVYFVDRILKGAKPSELPVEQPTKFYLVINLKTAKAIGFTIPPSVLGRADQIIE
jgi:putative ABC transport system substrate-binding protein